MSSRPGTGTASAEPLGWAQLREAAAGAELAALLDSGERSALDDAQLVDAITASQRLVNVYASRQLAMAAELHRRRAAVPRSKTEVGATTQTVAELIPALYQSRYRLHQRLHLVEGLTTLPRVAALFAAGRLEEYAVRCIVEEFATLTDPELRATAEAELLHRLLRDDDAGAEQSSRLVPATVGEVARLARQVVAEADPAGFDQKHRRAFGDRRSRRCPNVTGWPRWSSATAATTSTPPNTI